MNLNNVYADNPSSANTVQSDIAKTIMDEYYRAMSAKAEKVKEELPVESWTAPAANEPNEAAVAEKEIGMAAAASKSQDLVQAAQAVARKLGRNGAVTIDDVVHEMKRMGYVNVGAGAKDAPKNWKGSVFASGEWVCTGSIASRETSAHGRHVRQWCLKSWVREHPMNGTNNDASAFSLFKLYEEARHSYPDERFLFVIGRDRLDQSFLPLGVAETVRYTPDGKVRKSSKTLYGKEVLIVDGIGAIAIPESQRGLYVSTRG